MCGAKKPSLGAAFFALQYLTIATVFSSYMPFISAESATAACLIQKKYIIIELVIYMLIRVLNGQLDVESNC